MLKEKIRKRKLMTNIRKDPIKTQQNAKYMRNLESEQQRKQNKQVPKWQLLNQVVKILPLYITQLQIVVRHFLANKHLYRNIAKADLLLPKSPNKKAEVIQRLATKYKLRINVKENRGRR